jgi:hypothetical protein
MKASTLPELLVTMIVGGVLLLTIFDGLDIVRRSVGDGELTDFGSGLARLQEWEMLQERSDSVVVKDSLCLFYRNGKVTDTLDVQE